MNDLFYSLFTIYHSRFFLLSSLTALDLIAQHWESQVDLVNLKLILLSIGSRQEHFVSRERFRVFSKIIMRCGNKIIGHDQIRLGFDERLELRQSRRILFQFIECGCQIRARREVIGLNSEDATEDHDSFREASCLHERGSVSGRIANISRLT